MVLFIFGALGATDSVMVGARRAADGGLIDVDDFVEMFQPVNVAVRRGVFAAFVDVQGGGALESVVDKG